MKRNIVATLFAFFALSAYGQEAQRIEEVATLEASAPSWVSDEHAATQIAARNAAHTPQIGFGQSCPDFLIASPRIIGGASNNAPLVALFAGCEIPAGAWLRVETSYPSGNTAENWCTTQSLPPGRLVVWSPKPTLGVGGVFALTIMPGNAPARQMQTTYDGPVDVQSVNEQVTPTTATDPFRTIVLAGSFSGDVRALFGGVDITNRRNVKSGVALFDVSDFTASQGVVYLLTIANGPEMRTVSVLHPDCRARKCSVNQPPPPTVPVLKIIPNPAAPNPITIPAGAANVRIGSYALTVGQNTKISSIGVVVGVPYLQNLKVTTSIGAQFGATVSNLAADRFTFSGEVIIPAGSSMVLDISADIMSAGVGTFTPATTLVGVSAQDLRTGSFIPTQSVAGQTFTISRASPTLVATSESGPGRDVAMGTASATVASVRLFNKSDIEDVRVAEITVLDRTKATQATLTSVQLEVNAIAVGKTIGVRVNEGYLYQFRLASPLTLRAMESTTLLLKADVAPYTPGSSDNTTHTLVVADSSSIKATGVTSGLAVTVIATGTGSDIRVLRSTVTVSGTSAPPHEHARIPFDEVGVITFAANPAGPVAINRLKVAFTGSAGGSIAKSAELFDGRLGLGLVALGQASITIDASVGTATWSFAPVGGFVIPAGATASLSIRVNSTNVPSGAHTLTTVVVNSEDVLFTDGLDSAATTGITLNLAAAPVVLGSANYQ